MADIGSHYPPSVHSASESTPVNRVKPPRPPNAWILFRADKARGLPKGAGAPQQAAVSKIISQMWKNVTPDVKAHYEHLADMKKALHAAQYPDYRFQPVKKEDKDRLKEKKRAERDAERGPSRRTRTLASHRYAPYANDHASTPPAMPPGAVYPVPAQSFYPGGANYLAHGAFGPTPPMSAASSPVSTPDADLPETPEEQQEPVTQLTLPTDFGDYQDQSEAHTFDDLSSFSEFQQPFSSAAAPSSDWGLASQSAAPGYLTLDVPASAVPQDASWATPIREFDESLLGLVNDTRNPSIFTLAGFNPETITSNPAGAINLAVNDFEFDAALFEGFDFNSLVGLDAFNQDYSQPSSFDIDQYLNLDPNTVDPSAIAHQSSPSQALPSPAPTEPSPSTSYQPPAGAAMSATRRVGGTWAQFRAQTPDAVSPLAYGVPAN